MPYETLAKAIILGRGVYFTEEALSMAQSVNAKGQNMVYNAPKGYQPNKFRPQELLISGYDGYETCVSAIAPTSDHPVVASVKEGALHLSAPGCDHIFENLLSVKYVTQPSYYLKKTRRGTPITRIVSACGLDELNIWPWHDCAISRLCTFCGVNKVNSLQKEEMTFFKSRGVREIPIRDSWQNSKEFFIEELLESIDIALEDECYDQHAHLILISGNLKNDELDFQAEIYADIASHISRVFPGRFTEGIVAVTAPPKEEAYLHRLKESGVEIVVFNLEAWTPESFEKECPGKHDIGRDHYISMLTKAVDVFGWGRSWCNFVLGLDSVEDTLEGCRQLAMVGISPSANVLHLDEGSRCKKQVPKPKEIAVFFRELAGVYKTHSLSPYYCQKALRTSLSNEAYCGRLDKTLDFDPIDLLPD